MRGEARVPMAIADACVHATAMAVRLLGESVRTKAAHRALRGAPLPRETLLSISTHIAHLVFSRRWSFVED